MKKIFLVISIAFSIISWGQAKETFDLASYTAPKGWKKQPGEAAIQFSKEDAAKGTYCLITLYKSVPGKTGSKENFDLAWASLVKEMVTVTAAPEMYSPSTENGWETQSGYAQFESNDTKGVAILATSSCAEKMVNMIILTNTDIYEKEMTGFLESISLKKMAASSPANNNNSPGNNNNSALLGTWGANASDNSSYRMKNGIMNYIKRQYTFNANGTYTFVSKTFDPLMNNLFLGKENGTYTVSGNTILINPSKSVLEAWTKKNGGDDWGTRLNSQNVTLEKVSYQFTKHYFSGIQVWSLVLQAGKATQRDGPFTNSTEFNNAWYYNPISANNIVIKLPN